MLHTCSYALFLHTATFYNYQHTTRQVEEGDPVTDYGSVWREKRYSNQSLRIPWDPLGKNNTGVK